MAFGPEYGETLFAEEDVESLTDQARVVVGDPIRWSDVCELEQVIWAQVTDDLLAAVVEGWLTTEEILTGHFVRHLHSHLYVRAWPWAGRHRRLETNVGVAPEQIAVRLYRRRRPALAMATHSGPPRAAVGPGSVRTPDK